MHYFTGNMQTGAWYFMDHNNVGNIFTPEEVKMHKEIVWMRTEDSGDFYWPHMPVKDKPEPVPLEYMDE